MSKLEISGYWNIIRGKLKQQLAKLTDDDFRNLQGRQEERLGRMQKRTCKRREAVENVVKEAFGSLFYE